MIAASIASEASCEGRLLLLSDFDGTIAPTVSDPPDALIPGRTRCVLERLVASDAVRVGIVSGRVLADLRSRVALPGAVLVGSGGIEFDFGDGCVVAACAAEGREELRVARRAAGEAVAGLERVRIEDKAHGFTIHHRGADPATVGAVRELARGLGHRHPVIGVIVGTLGVEFAPDSLHDKGAAVGAVVRGLGGAFRTVVFAGNDANDAPAMRAVEGLGGLSVAVGEAAPEAMLRLGNVDEWTAFLEELADGLRAPAP